jgi:hypothetical protein
MNLELQQRGLEYSGLLTSRWDGLRGELLAKMPIIDEATYLRRKYGSGAEEPSKASGVAPVRSVAPAAEVSLLDLDDIFGGSSTSSGPSHTSSAGAPTGASQSNLDLLSDIFGSTTLASAPVAPLPSQQPQQPLVQDFFSMPAVPQQQQSQSQSTTLRMTIYDSAALQVSLEVSKPNPAALANTRVIAQYSNKSADTISDFVFLVQTTVHYTYTVLFLSYTIWDNQEVL